MLFKGVLIGIVAAIAVCAAATVLANHTAFGFWHGAIAGALFVLWVWFGLNLAYALWVLFKGY